MEATGAGRSTRVRIREKGVYPIPNWPYLLSLRIKNVALVREEGDGGFTAYDIHDFFIFWEKLVHRCSIDLGQRNVLLCVCVVQPPLGVKKEGLKLATGKAAELCSLEGEVQSGLSCSST
jgi:hypothetical protein